jgi:hypothetical protein
MSTKNIPGPFDDYADLAADEPYFILRASRQGDQTYVRQWASDQRIGEGTNLRGEDAYKTAEAMDAWRDAHVKASDADQVLLALCRQVHSEKHDPNVTFANCPEVACVSRRKAMMDIAKLKS